MAKTEARMSLKPLGDKVVVEVVDEPQTTASGIVLPDTAKEKSQRGKVVAVGPGKVLDNGEREPMDVSVGDTVVFAKYGGTELDLGGKEYMILSLRDIHAIVE
jgi:chaperonin GroES